MRVLIFILLTNSTKRIVRSFSQPCEAQHYIIFIDPLVEYLGNKLTTVIYLNAYWFMPRKQPRLLGTKTINRSKGTDYSSVKQTVCHKIYGPTQIVLVAPRIVLLKHFAKDAWSTDLILLRNTVHLVIIHIPSSPAQ